MSDTNYKMPPPDSKVLDDDSWMNPVERMFNKMGKLSPLGTFLVVLIWPVWLVIGLGYLLKKMLDDAVEPSPRFRPGIDHTVYSGRDPTGRSSITR
jgi:hypothetical protein